MCDFEHIPTYVIVLSEFIDTLACAMLFSYLKLLKTNSCILVQLNPLLPNVPKIERLAKIFILN